MKSLEPRSILKLLRFTSWGRLSITSKITLGYLLLSLIPILAIGILAYRNSRASLENEIIDKLQAVAENKSYIIKSWLRDQLSDAANLAGNTDVRALLSPAFRVVYPNLVAQTPEGRMERVKTLITSLQETNPSYVDMLIADNEGRVIASSSKALLQEGKSVSEIGLTKLEKNEAFFVSPVFFSYIAQLHVFVISTPIHDNNAIVVGNAILEVDLRPIHRLLEERSGLGNTGEVLLVDHDFRMLTHSRFSEESTLLKLLPDNAAWRAGIDGKPGEANYRDYRDVPVIASYLPLREMGAVLIAKKDQSESFSPVVRLRNTVLGVIALTMVLATGVSLWAARVTARPILQAEALERLKADFTAMIVHDLRSPLTAVLSSAALIEDGVVGPVTEEQKKWLINIQTSVRKLVELVNDFLDLSKIEAGRIDLTRKEVDLNRLIQDSLEQHRILADNKGVSLKNRAYQGLPPVQADPRRLEQVLNNLLSNAIKFTPAGGEIEVGAVHENATEAKVWVKDNGVGIPTGETGSLFELYQQTSSGKGSDQKGTGLGLVICKMIVETHGGKIWVESEEGKGTTFFFSLPFEA
ncbi:MAG TPA: sensor histidine kinase [Candidatus Binatia bacterium]|nr:sensor histidine kinase [Candidatus Binatia bacterium]